MKKIILFILFFPFLLFAQEKDSIIIKKISDEIFVSGECYKNLEYLCKKIGSRLSGSAGAEKAVQWTYSIMKNYGFDTVYLQEVMVPHWIRGEKETGKVISSSGKKPVNITALGGSIATAKKGITAGIVEVKNFDELKKLGKENIQGKIVFLNHPFDITKIIPFEMYAEAGKYRYIGASESARYGAVACVVRSMTNYISKDPNSGAMGYNDSLPKIPACAISTADAEELSEILKKDSKAKFFLKLHCKILPDVKSYNVIGELRGDSDSAGKEIIAIGGHLDSWDLAQGAHDDGTGVMQSIEVLRVLKKIGVKPRRTLRAVMFINEENGLRGANEYAKQSILKNEKHILAIESDAGGFTPRGFTLSMPDAKKSKILSWKDYFFPYGAYDFSRKGGGADISPLEKKGVPVMELSPDNQRYFIIHHTTKDVFEEVNKRELELGAIVMTMMVYLVNEYGL